MSVNLELDTNLCCQSLGWAADIGRVSLETAGVPAAFHTRDISTLNPDLPCGLGRADRPGWRPWGRGASEAVRGKKTVERRPLGAFLLVHAHHRRTGGDA